MKVEYPPVYCGLLKNNLCLGLAKFRFRNPPIDNGNVFGVPYLEQKRTLTSTASIIGTLFSVTRDRINTYSTGITRSVKNMEKISPAAITLARGLHKLEPERIM